MVGEQMGEDGLDVIAETAALGIGPLEVAADEAQGEFLRQLVGLVGVVQDRVQEALDGAGVAVPQRRLRGGDARALALMGVEDQRPARRNAAEALPGFGVGHGQVYGAGAVPPRAGCRASGSGHSTAGGFGVKPYYSDTEASH
jgi:hypothetical protein